MLPWPGKHLMKFVMAERAKGIGFGLGFDMDRIEIMAYIGSHSLGFLTKWKKL